MALVLKLFGEGAEEEGFGIEGRSRRRGGWSSMLILGFALSAVGVGIGLGEGKEERRVGELGAGSRCAGTLVGYPSGGCEG